MVEIFCGEMRDPNTHTKPPPCSFDLHNSEVADAGQWDNLFLVTIFWRDEPVKRGKTGYGAPHQLREWAGRLLAARTPVEHVAFWFRGDPDNPSSDWWTLIWPSAITPPADQPPHKVRNLWEPLLTKRRKDYRFAYVALFDTAVEPVR